jgi:hypothetical protein
LFVGTNAFDTNASGNRMMSPMDCADSGPCHREPDAGSEPAERIAEQQRDGEAGEQAGQAGVGSPTTSPASATNVAHTAFDDWAPKLLLGGPPDVVQRELQAAVRNILDV